MNHLGSFGAAIRELDPAADPDTFDFFGETFRVTGVLPPMLMLQLGASTTGKIDDQEGLGAMWEALRCCLTTPTGDEQQFVRFYRLAVDRCCSLDDLIKVTMALFEAQAGRPTEGLPASSPGQSTTSPSSSTSSSTHPAFAHLTPVNHLVGG